MLKITRDINVFNYILDNLRDEDKQEVFEIWGENWKKFVLDSVKNADVLVAFVDDLPIAMGGFVDLKIDNPKIAMVWLLSTKLVSENKKLFFSYVKSQLDSAEKKYDILFNYIYKSNFRAKGWLRKFGFNFDNPSPLGLKVRKNFEFFYKTSKYRKEK